jgi:hypothetical protein
MIKIRLLAGLVATVAILVMSAAPAGAWFRSLNQAKTQGQVKLQVTTLTAGAATVSCQSANGEWSIQTKGNWWEHEQKNPNPELSKQVKTTFGPHLNIKITQWNNCKAIVMGIKTEAKVAACEFQLQQQKGEFNLLAEIVAPCQISIPIAKCSITVFEGNHEGINEGLSVVKSENVGQSVLATASVGEIHGEGCGEKFAAAKFESLPGGLRAEGLEVA